MPRANRQTPEERRLLAAIRKRVAEVGGRVEVSSVGATYEVEVEAPRGSWWAGEQLHAMLYSANIGPWSHEEGLADLLDRMKHGVEPCGPGCEWCADPDEDEADEE